MLRFHAASMQGGQEHLRYTARHCPFLELKNRLGTVALLNEESTSIIKQSWSASGQGERPMRGVYCIRRAQMGANCCKSIKTRLSSEPVAQGLIEKHMGCSHRSKGQSSSKIHIGPRN